MDKEKFDIIDVEYIIDLKQDHSMALITPRLICNSFTKQVLVGEVRLDGMDMIPAFKVTAQEGKNSFKLKPIKIFNPLIRLEGDEEGIKYYNMELMLFTNFSSAKTHLKAIAVTPGCVSI